MKEPVILTMGLHDPKTWETEDFGVIHFATPEDARKAAALLIKMQEYYASHYAAQHEESKNG